jgi:hypothetical protein
MGFLLKFGRQTGCVHAEKNAFGSGFVSDLLLAAFVCLAANFFAAYRPAGTREALPGAMSRFEERNSKLEDR